jgi:small-conductance mechanosensitive channel
MDFQPLLQSLHSALASLRDPLQLVQLALTLLALALALWLGRRWHPDDGDGWRVDLRRRLTRPAVVLLVALIGASLLRVLDLPYRGLTLLSALALSLLLIRGLAYLLRRVLKAGPLLDASEQLISGLVWLGVALYLLDWLGPTLQLLDAAAVEFGERRFSILDGLLLLGVTAILLLIGGLLSGVLERRLMALDGLSIGVRVGVAKVLRFVLILIALLIALNVVGINLTSLAVFSGALGVGLGFGLQRIASNFISGFILIMDRSIRPGDVITVGDSFGWVQALHARYVVVRNRDGVDTLIPNENLIISEVINWSYADTSVRLKVPVQISYEDDPAVAMALMVELARKHPRVESEPPPVARLMAFGESGLDLELRVWIKDPQDGINNIRSDLNLAIWQAFKQASITIPYPQRDLHVRHFGESNVKSRITTKDRKDTKEELSE